MIDGRMGWIGGSDGMARGAWKERSVPNCRIGARGTPVASVPNHLHLPGLTASSFVGSARGLLDDDGNVSLLRSFRSLPSQAALPGSIGEGGSRIGGERGVRLCSCGLMMARPG